MAEDLILAGALLYDQGITTDSQKSVLEKGAPYPFSINVPAADQVGFPIQRALYETLFLFRAFLYKTPDLENSEEIALSSWPATLQDSVDEILVDHEVGIS
jgi:hypothetical protein